MNIESFMLCDAATDNNGKLNVLGAFDSLYAKEAPITHPHCAVALRMRFSKLEEGAKKVKIDIIDADGRNVVPSMNGSINVKMPGVASSSAVNMILNLQGIKFNAFGEYMIALAVDGRAMASLPLFVRQIQR